MVKLIKAGTTFGCKRYSGAAAGDLAKEDAKVAASTDFPRGFVVDDVPTTNPPEILNLYGDGSIIDITGATGAPAAQNVGVVLWSDGDGTISTTKPTPGIGSMRYKVGTIVGDENGSTSLFLLVDIKGEVQEA